MLVQYVVEPGEQGVAAVICLVISASRSSIISAVKLILRIPLRRGPVARDLLPYLCPGPERRTGLGARDPCRDVRGLLRGARPGGAGSYSMKCIGAPGVLPCLIGGARRRGQWKSRLGKSFLA